ARPVAAQVPGPTAEGGVAQDDRELVR
ncbi:lipopolysaccharide biosynthesis protein, partial [Streptomyces sp. SID724]|nr:lipopolysaccharide biosynthesis protein [Streptomyces sp. SID724]